VCLNSAKISIAVVWIVPIVNKACSEDKNPFQIVSSRISYSLFLEYLDTNHLKKVDLFENSTVAIVEVVSSENGNRIQTVRVQLPGTSAELLSKFREKKIDFASHTNSEEQNFTIFNLFGNLVLPMLLMGGLFFISRRQGRQISK